jgi:hypothetical protein
VIDIDLSKTFNGGALLDLIKELIRLDRHWVPQEKGYSLYIRPAMSASLVSQVFPHAQPQLISFRDLLSWHSNYHRRLASRFSSSLCYLHPGWAVLPGWVQTSGFARYNGVRAGIPWRSVQEVEHTVAL